MYQLVKTTLYLSIIFAFISFAMVLFHLTHLNHKDSFWWGITALTNVVVATTNRVQQIILRGE